MMKKEILTTIICIIAFNCYSQFEKITSDPIVNDSHESGGAAWTDYNNDGFDDLYINNGLGNNPNSLFMNNGNGSFTKIDDISINQSGQGRDATWGDFNNDGFVDLYITNSFNNTLFLNNGDNSFSEVQILDNTTDDTNGSAWADYDNDGFIDLAQCSNPTASNGNNIIFQNNGDTTFSKIELDDNTSSSTPQWIDYNNDGLVDLYIVNYSTETPNLMYKNDSGVLNLVEITGLTTLASFSTGSSWADYDNDGDFDCIVINNANSNHLFFDNNGDGTFTQSQNEMTINNYRSNSSSWADYDNDGLMDIAIVGNNGNFLFKNTGSGFENVSSSMGIADTIGAQSVTWTDYNKDGFLDMFVTNFNGQDQLFKNTPNENNWINIKVKGTNSNAQGIGSKVKIKTNSGWQYRMIETKSGFYSQSSINAAFGIQLSTSIDTILVEWPTKGFQERINEQANQFIDITEIDFPSAPISFSAEPNEPLKVYLEWLNSSSIGTSFRLERSTDSLNFKIIAPKLLDEHYTDNDVEGGITYYYRVAKNIEGGFSLYSDIVKQFVRSQQTISFDAIEDKEVLDQPLQLVAESTSGLEVYFFINEGQENISLDGKVLTILDTGRVSIGAFALDNELFLASDTTFNTFLILRNLQSVSFDVIPDKDMSDQPFQLVAVSSSELEVSFFIDEGHDKVSLNGKQVSIIGTGLIRIGSYASGNEIYLPSDSVFQEFAIFEPLSITESTNSISVYPNPTEQIINISLQSKLSIKDALITIHSTDGSLVRSVMLNKTDSSIKLDGLKSGVYFLHVDNQLFTILKK